MRVSFFEFDCALVANCWNRTNQLVSRKLLAPSIGKSRVVTAEIENPYEGFEQRQSLTIRRKKKLQQQPSVKTWI
jgi:hypothetical protein